MADVNLVRFLVVSCGIISIFSRFAHFQRREKQIISKLMYEVWFLIKNKPVIQIEPLTRFLDNKEGGKFGFILIIPLFVHWIFFSPEHQFCLFHISEKSVISIGQKVFTWYQLICSKKFYHSNAFVIKQLSMWMWRAACLLLTQKHNY